MILKENFYKYYKTVDEVAWAIFFAVDHDQTIDPEVVEKLLKDNPHLEISMEDLVKKTIAFSKQFISDKERVLQRFSSNRDIRSIVRDIKVDLPLAQITKLVLFEMDIVISHVSQMNDKHLATKESFETFIELITDEDYLKNEFISTMQLVCMHTKIKKDATDEQITNLDKLILLFARYQDAYMKNLRLDHIKEEIRILLKDEI